MDAVTALARGYLFRVAPGEAVARVAARGRVYAVPRGGFVYRAGDVATHLYSLISGQLREVASTPRGQPSVYEIYRPGSLLGEPALFAPGRRRVISVEAVRDSVVLAIDRTTLIDFLLEHPAAMLAAMEGLAIQVVNAVADMNTLAYLPIEDRVAVRLAELCGNHGEHRGGEVHITLHLDQSTLAQSVGASRENVNRALRRLAAAGIVRTGRARVVITDPARLSSRTSDWMPIRSRNASE